MTDVRVDLNFDAMKVNGKHGAYISQGSIALLVYALIHAFELMKTGGLGTPVKIAM